MDRRERFGFGMLVGSMLGIFSMAYWITWMGPLDTRKEAIQAEVAAELASGRCICVDGLERLVELVDE